MPAMLSILLGFAVESGFWIAPAIVAVACVGFARHFHSRASTGLAVGALGKLVTDVVSSVVAAWLGQRELASVSAGGASYRAAAILQGQVSFAFGMVGILFALIFAVCLLLVLRDFARRRGATTSEALAPPAEPPA